MIFGDTLYRDGFNSILRRCLTHEDDDFFLNDCHVGACGRHLSRYATVQKILCTGYFWPTIFRYCILAVRSCHAYQIFDRKICKLSTPMHPIVSMGRFSKWGIDFMTCNPRLFGGHGYIIVAVD